MWFGTWDGLNSWNGRHFRLFSHDASVPESICNNIIRGICEDFDGGLWISTDRGIDRYDPSTDTFTHFLTKEADVAASEKAFSLYAREGQVYAAVDRVGVFRFRDGDFSLILECPLQIEDFFVTGDGTTYLLTKDGEIRRDMDRLIESGVRRMFLEGSEVWIQRTGSQSIESHGLPSWNRMAALRVRGKVNDIETDDAGNLLVACERGLFRYSEGAFHTLLEDIPVVSAFAGSQGIVWGGTDMSGVAMILPRMEEFTTVTDIFGGAAVRCFARDGQGRLLIGTKGSGLLTLSDEGRILRRLGASDGLPDNSVYALTRHDGAVWIGSEGEGLSFLADNRRTPVTIQIDPLLRSVYSICFTHDGRLLAGTSGGGLFELTLDGYEPTGCKHYGADVLGSDIVYSLLEDSDGSVWIGTRGGGIIKMAPEGGLTPCPGPEDVICIEKGTSGSIWVGATDGLWRISGSGSVVSHLTESDGLPGNNVHGILSNSDDCVWISTGRGLCRIVPSAREFTHFNAIDGLQGNEFSDGAYFRDGETLYFGGIRGFSSFKPSDINDAGVFPRLLLSSFYLDNQRMPVESLIEDGVLTIRPGKGTFSFSFVPLDYLDSHRCEISYMLEGFNPSWVRIGGSSDAIVFSNMRPGRYTLRVRCTNADGVWSPDSFVLPVQVLPMWYLSTLALIIYAIIAIMVIFQLIRALKLRTTMNTMAEVHEGELRFFTNIAHEFSNSLTLIYGPCEQIKLDGKLSAPQQRSLDTIEANSERMQSLIRELLMFRKAESGHLSINITPVEVDKLILKTADLFREKMSGAGIALGLDILPLVWNTDRECLDKILFNLISNAVKYTPSGGRISVTSTVRNGKLIIEVTNTGVGLTRREMERIFDRYAVLNRLKKESSRSHDSHGIGLSVCKGLTKAIGGKIIPDSDGNSYVTFRIVLPPKELPAKISADIHEETGVRPVPSAAEESFQRPVRLPDILVVDNDPEIRSFIAGLFKERFNVMEASNGFEALAKIAEREPVLLISDVMMDGMDGNALLRAVKDNPATSHIPFILLSAQGALENQIEGIENGADAYIAKPFNPRHLTAVADRLLGQEQTVREYGESPYAAVKQFEGGVVRNEDRELLMHITEVIAENLDNEALSIDDLASAAAVSKMKLYRKLKELVGMSPTEYIRHIRLENAARLLKTTSKTVQEIIYACGFSSKTWFYREFSKKFGKTPNEYRK